MRFPIVSAKRVSRYKRAIGELCRCDQTTFPPFCHNPFLKSATGLRSASSKGFSSLRFLRVLTFKNRLLFSVLITQAKSGVKVRPTSTTFTQTASIKIQFRLSAFARFECLRKHVECVRFIRTDRQSKNPRKPARAC